MKNPIARCFLGRVVAAVVLVAGLPSLAAAQQDGKLDAVLRDRSTRLAGWSRVIVEFTGEPDVRVFSRGTTGRRVGQQMQAGEVENTALASLAADGRVKKVWADRPAFPTLERTGSAVGAALAREEFGLTGRGIGVAVIDSGITSYHDDLYTDRSHNADTAIVHFKDFTRPSNGNSTDLATDDYGHGTHVARNTSGSGADSDGRRTGVAPGADLIGLRVLESGRASCRASALT